MTSSLSQISTQPGGAVRPRGGVLVTGFEPFHQWRVNSSWEGARRLARRRPEIAALRLPVDHDGAAEALAVGLARSRPRILLMCGLAAGRDCRLERIGRERGGRARRGAWPWAAAAAALRRAGLASRFSEDAGRFVCDTSYAAALAWRAERGWPERVAFLHVPPLSPAWRADRIAAAIEAALDPLGAQIPRRAQRRRETRGTR